MSVLTDEAIILQVFAYGETSKILRILTATHGVRSAIARGARRPKSRFGSILEPFTEGTATLYLRDARELQTLAAFELTQSAQRLGSDLLRFGGASLLAELVLRTASEESQPGLFEALRSALQRLRTTDPAQLECTILAEAWRLVALLGFSLRLDECISCGRAVRDSEEVRLDYASGGVRCAACAAGMPGRTVPAQARTDLRRMTLGVAVPLERTTAHWRLLRRFLDHHVLEGGTLRSLAFLENALGQADDA
jgi:DNA repair protein RecO (recombination protein O)